MKTMSEFRVVGSNAIVADLEGADHVVIIKFDRPQERVTVETFDCGQPRAFWDVEPHARVFEDPDALRHACLFLLACIDVEAVELSTATIIEALATK